MNPSRLVILYGKGGLSDVGRHAVQAALEQPSVSNIVVLTEYPDLLEEPNWNCGCPNQHSFTDEDRRRFRIVPVSSWDDESLDDHFDQVHAVISCVGNRQPFIGHWNAFEGNQAVIRAMVKHNVQRVVAVSSTGVEEDWPPTENFWVGRIILSFLFLTFSRRAFQDLTRMEKALRSSELDYVLVRPTGLGEEVVPQGKWFIQNEKHKDPIGLALAKLDAARFMVEQAIQPSFHREAVVLGSDPAMGLFGQSKRPSEALP